MNLLRRANWRFFCRQPRQLTLTIVGIALGVGIMTGIDLSIESVRRSFELSVDAVVGKTTHHIVAAAGSLDERLYPSLRATAGIGYMAPVVEGYLNHQGRMLHLLGIDPFAEETGTGRARGARDSLARLLAQPDTVMLGKTSLTSLGLMPGGRLNLAAGGQVHTVSVVGAIEGDGWADPGLEGVMVADIATAQEILGRIGFLDRIDVRLGADPEAEERLRAVLPAGWMLESAAGRKTAAARMTEAFSTNLKALSTLALLVGMFIIYNAMTFSVLQRRQVLATLRMLGVTRRQILAEILLEAGALGLAGALAGTALGLLAAQGLLQLVTRTISDVYFVLTVTRLLVDPMVLVTGVLVGIAASVVAAFVPAVEAAWSSPSAAQRRSLLEQRTRRVLPWIALVGLCLLVAAFGLLRMTAALSLGIAGVFCLLLGYSLLTPWSVSMLISAAAWLTRPRPNRAGGQDSFSPGAISRPADGYASVAVLPRLALRGILGTLSRTGVAVAALTLSVSASIGTGVMVYSFRLAVEEWLDQILQADIYVALPGIPGRASETLPPDMQNRAGALPGVAEVSTGRRVFLETSLGQTETLVLDPAGPNRPGFRFKGKESAQIWRDFMTRDVVLISEPYASRHGLEVGDRIAFATDRGRVELAVGGIFFDYRSDRGIAVLHRHLYDRFWRDEGVSSLGLFLAPGADLSTVKSEVSRVLTGEQPLIVRSNREIRAASLDVFDRTFTVTQVLRLQALAVAFVGILSALLALQTERARDLAILRAIGLTPNQVRVLVLLQTGVLGLCAGMLAAPLGALVGFALVRVINLRSFGWSMDLALPADAFLEALLLAVGAALLAGIYPAWRASRIAPAAALREE